MDVGGLRTKTVGGVHVHGGDDCEANQGPHYFKYDEDLPSNGDPWFNTATSIAPSGAGYVTDDEGKSTTSFFFDQGYGYSQTKGKLIIIHDTVKTPLGENLQDLGEEGQYKKIACGVLEPYDE